VIEAGEISITEYRRVEVSAVERVRGPGLRLKGLSDT
jgi:hypothetical protein